MKYTSNLIALDERAVDLTIDDNIRILIRERDLIPLANALKDRREYQTDHSHWANSLYVTWCKDNTNRVSIYEGAGRRSSYWQYEPTDEDIDNIIMDLNNAHAIPESDIQKRPVIDVRIAGDSLQVNIGNDLHESFYTFVDARYTSRFRDMFNHRPVFGNSHHRHINYVDYAITWHEDGSIDIIATKKHPYQPPITVSLSLTSDEREDLFKRMTKTKKH